MSINGISTGYYPTGYINNKTTKTTTGASFANKINSIAGNTGKGHIVYMKTDDMLYSGGNGTGLSFYIKYAENSTEEDPTVVAKGVDENGKEFEQTIHINKINPKSATLVEMRALEAYLGVEKNGGLTSLPMLPVGGTGEMGLHDRRNFMDMFEKQISDMALLKQQKSAAYYKYSMQAYWDFMNNRLTGKNTAMEAYLSSANTAYGVKQAYETYQSENYKIVPDNEAGCFDIYNNQGERLGAFSYSDIKIRQDASTGKQLLISEHGTMSYDALVLDNELKNALQNIIGKDSLETEKLQGFTLQRHSGTGIQYLIKDGEEGQGGKVLLQSKEDIAQYEALAEAYLNKYPNLISDKNAAYIWSDLEIKGLAQRTQNGIISTGFNGMSYNDNSNYKNNWSVLFSENTYKAIYDYIQNNKISIEEMQKFSSWQKIFDDIGSRYDRIASKEEEKQGYFYI